jgi:hypothetical protein
MFATLCQQYLKQLSITTIYDSIGVKCKDLEYHESNPILRQLWQGIEPLR